MHIADQLRELRTEQRIALHRGVQLAGLHGFEGTAHAVDGNDADVLAGLQSSLFDGLDGADGHVIVVRVQHVDLLLALGLDEGLHHFLALGAREIAALRAHDLEACVLADHFAETRCAVIGGRRTHGALQFDHADGAGAAGAVLDQPARRATTFLDEVRSDQRQIQRGVGDFHRAVGEHHRDAGRLGLLQHGVPAGFHHGREGDHIHLLRDERAQCLDLVFLLLLTVGELELEFGFHQRILDGAGVGRAPFTLGAHLAEAHGDRVIRALVGAA